MVGHASLTFTAPKLGQTLCPSYYKNLRYSWAWGTWGTWGFPYQQYYPVLVPVGHLCNELSAHAHQPQANPIYEKQKIYWHSHNLCSAIIKFAFSAGYTWYFWCWPYWAWQVKSIWYLLQICMVRSLTGHSPSQLCSLHWTLDSGFILQRSIFSASPQPNLTSQHLIL